MAKLIGKEANEIILVPTLAPWRFVPEDILYHDDGKILSLKATHKEYFDALKSEMNDYMAVRVCIVGDRSVIYKNAAKIYTKIKEEIK